MKKTKEQNHQLYNSYNTNIKYFYKNLLNLHFFKFIHFYIYHKKYNIKYEVVDRKK